jgi:hypothetical protein
VGLGNAEVPEDGGLEILLDLLDGGKRRGVIEPTGNLLVVGDDTGGGIAGVSLYLVGE